MKVAETRRRKLPMPQQPIGATPVKSSCTWKPTYTLARLMVGDHHSVKRRLGIWFSPDRWALVSFLYFMLSSNPEAFSQNSPSHVGKYVPLKRVCSRMPSTPGGGGGDNGALRKKTNSFWNKLPKQELLLCWICWISGSSTGNSQPDRLPCLGTKESRLDNQPRRSLTITYLLFGGGNERQ